jgi:hypothetical protein
VRLFFRTGRDKVVANERRHVCYRILLGVRGV